MPFSSQALFQRADFRNSILDPIMRYSEDPQGQEIMPEERNLFIELKKRFAPEVAGQAGSEQLKQFFYAFLLLEKFIFTGSASAQGKAIMANVFPAMVNTLLSNYWLIRALFDSTVSKQLMRSGAQRLVRSESESVESHATKIRATVHAATQSGASTPTFAQAMHEMARQPEVSGTSGFFFKFSFDNSHRRSAITHGMPGSEISFTNFYQHIETLCSLATPIDREKCYNSLLIAIHAVGLMSCSEQGGRLRSVSQSVRKFMGGMKARMSTSASSVAPTYKTIRIHLTRLYFEALDVELRDTATYAARMQKALLVTAASPGAAAVLASGRTVQFAAESLYGSAIDALPAVVPSAVAGYSLPKQQSTAHFYSTPETQRVVSGYAQLQTESAVGSYSLPNTHTSLPALATERQQKGLKLFSQPADYPKGNFCLGPMCDPANPTARVKRSDVALSQIYHPTAECPLCRRFVCNNCWNGGGEAPRHPVSSPCPQSWVEKFRKIDPCQVPRLGAAASAAAGPVTMDTPTDSIKAESMAFDAAASTVRLPEPELTYRNLLQPATFAAEATQVLTGKCVGICQQPIARGPRVLVCPHHAGCMIHLEPCKQMFTGEAVWCPQCKP